MMGSGLPGLLKDGEKRSCPGMAAGTPTLLRRRPSSLARCAASSHLARALCPVDGGFLAPLYLFL